MDAKKMLGDWLRRRREAAHLERPQVEKKSGVYQSQISYYESGVLPKNPRATSFVRYREAIGLSDEEFFNSPEAIAVYASDWVSARPATLTEAIETDSDFYAPIIGGGSGSDQSDMAAWHRLLIEMADNLLEAKIVKSESGYDIFASSISPEPGQFVLVRHREEEFEAELIAERGNSYVIARPGCDPEIVPKSELKIVGTRAWAITKAV